MDPDPQHWLQPLHKTPKEGTVDERTALFAGYGVGHVLNDLCASMWFTYLLLFYHKVQHPLTVYSTRTVSTLSFLRATHLHAKNTVFKKELLFELHSIGVDFNRLSCLAKRDSWCLVWAEFCLEKIIRIDWKTLNWSLFYFLSVFVGL